MSLITDIIKRYYVIFKNPACYNTSFELYIILLKRRFNKHFRRIFLCLKSQFW